MRITLILSSSMLFVPLSFVTSFSSRYTTLHRPIVFRKKSYFSTTTTTTTTATTATTTTTTTLLYPNENEVLACSKYGLDPKQNYIHPPFVYHEQYSFEEWPKHYTFPMNKFARLAHYLTTNTTTTTTTTTTTKTTTLVPLVQNDNHFFRPLEVVDLMKMDWLMGDLCPIDTTFVQRFIQGQLSKEECRTIGFREYTSHPKLIQRTLLEVAGTVLTCQLASQWGMAIHLAGGTHHATITSGAGYTILNDLAVATAMLPHHHRVLVVDCDVHQGDGTAQFSHVNGPLYGKLITLSLHCSSNYPQIKAQSTIDVGLPDGVQDDEYMEALEKAVEEAIRLYDPDFCIYNAGVDIYEHDVLGRLKVSEAGIRRRDHYVLNKFVSLGIPIAATIGGGYDKDVDALAGRHAIVHEEGAHIWRAYKMWEKRGAR